MGARDGGGRAKAEGGSCEKVRGFYGGVFCIEKGREGGRARRAG